MTEATIDVPVYGGHITAHRRTGQPPSLLFLHYWGGSGETWTRVVDLLPGHDTVVIDQRGWGESAELAGPYDVQQLASDARAVIDALSVDCVVVVGHSMGGKVAQVLAGEGTPSIVGLVLVAPAPPVPPDHISPEYQDQLSHAYDDPESIEFARDNILTYRELSTDAGAQVLRDSAASGEPEARLAWPQRGIAQNVADYARKIKVPTVVVAGQHDQVEPPAVLIQNLLPYIQGATIKTVNGAGHLLPLEAPEELAKTIEAFIADLP